MELTFYWEKTGHKPIKHNLSGGGKVWRSKGREQRVVGYMLFYLLMREGLVDKVTLEQRP